MSMAGLLLIVLLQFAWTNGLSQSPKRSGAGSFAYADSSGQHYTGTYNSRDGQPVLSSGNFPVPFSESAYPGAFHSNIQNQQLAYDAARKAFDLSSNQAGYYSNFASRLPQSPYNDFGGFTQYGGGYSPFPNFPAFDMSNYPNTAFASSVVRPGYKSQVAAISPENPNAPNVNINKVTRLSDNPTRRGYVSVSSNSFSTSSNLNGQEVNHRGSTTIVDDNGKVTKYSVGV